jgi:medium-chain acyl-[acyl-carrier-protein] hydrolase
MDRPFALFGHSLGAVLAFELARYLSSAGGPSPSHLIVSGHAAPQIPDERPPIYDLPDGGFIEKLREFGGTPEEVLGHRELMELLLPMLRADFQASETYVYRPGRKLACPVTALGGLRDNYVSRADLEAWAEQTSGEFSVGLFPGDHFYLNADEDQLLEVVAARLGRHLRGNGG